MRAAEPSRLSSRRANRSRRAALGCIDARRKWAALGLRAARFLQVISRPVLGRFNFGFHLSFVFSYDLVILHLSSV
jgi:hypothetical protein